MDHDHPNLQSSRINPVNKFKEKRLKRLTGSRRRRNPGASRKSTATLPPNVSRESTSTLRNTSEDFASYFMQNNEDENDRMEIDDSRTDIGISIEGTGEEMPLIVATDFGTTFSSVAYARRSKDSDPIIKIIQNYPDDPLRFGLPSLQVPTESWYPNERQNEEHLLDPEFDKLIGNNLRSRESPLDPTSDNDSQYSNDEAAGDKREREAGERLSVPADHIQPFVWGYGTEQEISPDMDRKNFNRIARSKLLLDKSAHTATVRDELQPVLTRLKKKRIIKKDVDVISHFLTRLFQHTKAQLKAEREITESTPIEHVLTVPAAWSAEACRTMQSAMTIATQNARFGNADDLFLVSEPEASAAFVLAESSEVNKGEAFLILDAGGGTVDATSYLIEKEEPLRLSKELVTPDGCLKGSSFLNEAFRDHLRQRLKGSENDVELFDYSVEGIIDKATLDFETKKRKVNINNSHIPLYSVQIQGLRADPAKHFLNNKLQLNRLHFIEIFRPCLQEIESLMKKQLIAATNAAPGYEVKKVILVGGFSASDSLRNFLASRLQTISRSPEIPYKVRLTDAIHIRNPETAVAQGAILRAWNKDEGPDRIIQSSYGFELMEPFNPGLHPEHKNIRSKYDKLDGQKYIENVIEWLVKKGEIVPSQKTKTLEVHQSLRASRKTFKCEETLWVTDDEPYSHYRSTHVKNKGAQKAGKVIVDFLPFIRSGLIKPEIGFEGEHFYKIDYDLVMIINGRNLRYEARWPRGGEVRAEGQICIAAAFRPGTN